MINFKFWHFIKKYNIIVYLYNLEAIYDFVLKLQKNTIY